MRTVLEKTLTKDSGIISMQSSVTIGPEFFRKAKSDYSNWKFAFVREIMQNSIDSGATEIRINIKNQMPDLEITVQDNGKGMNEDILRNKLFSLGSSGKDFANTTGGFGRAKEILYFANKSFQIHTNNLLVNGQGGSYKIEPSEPIQGTISKVILNDDSIWLWEPEFNQYFKSFTEHSNYKGKVFLNDLEISARAFLKEEIKTFSFGTLFKTDDFKNLCVVRINGQEMFSYATQCDFGLVLDIFGESSKYVSSNRDGFVWPYSSEFQIFLNDLASNSESAVRRLAPKVIRYIGKNSYLHTFSQDMEEVLNEISDEQLKQEIQYEVFKVENRIAEMDLEKLQSFADRMDTQLLIQKMNKTIVNIKSFVESNFKTDYDFEVVNHFNAEVPNKYLPENISKKNKYQMIAWRTIVYEILKMENMKQHFYTGFVFHDEILASHVSENGLHKYFLNPALGNFSERYTNNRASISKMIAVAIHEIVHGKGVTNHNEYFCKTECKLTGKVIDNLGTILKAVKDAWRNEK